MSNAHLAINLEGVERSFGDVRALDSVTLQVGSGEVVALLGHNGAGKTTTVRLLTGILAPDAGVVQVLGRDPQTDGPAVRRAAGVVSAVPAVDDRLTGWQNLEFVTDVFGVDRARGRRRSRELLEQFGLADRAAERVAGYSTGMRQRLALARALLPDPPVLLLDEPTAALDPVASRDVRALVERLSRDEARSVLLCSHNLVEVQQLCDRVVVLEHGRVIADGAPADLAARLGIGRLRLEVEPADLLRAEQVLAAAGAPAETGTGGRLAVTSLAGIDVPALIASLVGAGVRIHRRPRGRLAGGRVLRPARQDGAMSSTPAVDQGRRWDWRGIAAVVRRDLLVVRSSKPVVIPMVLVPAILLVLMPAAVVLSARLGADAIDLDDIAGLLALLPADLVARLAADPTAGLIEVAVVYLLSPMLLIVPLMTASVIAADAVAGERERRTLEGLLLTPLTDRELFAAKLIGAWLPAAAVGVTGGVVYAAVSDLAAAGVVDGLLFPNLVWAGLVLWVGPAIAAISLGVTVLVSARVKTVQEAFQIAGIIVIPVVALVISQAAGLMVMSRRCWPPAARCAGSSP